MKVTLQTINNNRYLVEVPEDATVRQLQETVYKTTTIKYSVRFLKGQQSLDKDEQLYFYDIQDGSTLSILMEPEKRISITVKTFKKGTVILEIDNTATVEELRDILVQNHDILDAQMHDMFLGKEQLQDVKLPLHYYDVENNSELKMSGNGWIRLHVVLANTYTLKRLKNMQLTDTVSDLAKVVTKSVDASASGSEDLVMFYTKSTPTIHHQLFTELDLPSRQLWEYGVEHMGYIFVIQYTSGGYINVQQGRSVHAIYETKNDETVFSLMLKIQDKLGLPFAQQRLFAIETQTSKRVHLNTVDNNAKLSLYEKFSLAIRQ